jgi:hypothetical protein
VHQYALADRGFRRQADHLHRQVDGLFHGIHFQASQWGTATEGKLTVNLSVSSPMIWRAWYGVAFPSNPATALFPFQVRIGHLMPGRLDRWWDIDERTRPDECAEEITGLIVKFGLPFLDRVRSLPEMLDLLRKDIAPGLSEPQALAVHAIVANELGLQKEASALLGEAANASKIGGFRSNLRLVADRAGIAF